MDVRTNVRTKLTSLYKYGIALFHFKDHIDDVTIEYVDDYCHLIFIYFRLITLILITIILV